MGRLFSDREIRGAAVFVVAVTLLIPLVRHLREDYNPQRALDLETRMEHRADSVERFAFDPNTVTYEELRRLGLSKTEAVSLIKYRAAGKVFRISEDVALCYGFSDSLYAALRPLIRIGERFAISPGSTPRKFPGRTPRPKIAPSPFLIDTVSASYLRAIGALSKRQAEVFIRWRDLSGIRDMEELRECYVISDSVAEALRPYVIFADRQPHPVESPVEINTADSAELRRVNGIGEKTVNRILTYRQRLGGFVRKEQLAEIPGITEANYEKIFKQICCDSCEIQKIDINFATPEQIGRHPYITPRMLRKLLKHRLLKGGWSTTEELVKAHIFTPEEAKRLAPYLHFGTKQTPQHP